MSPTATLKPPTLPRLGKLTAAIIIGLSLGVLIPPKPVTIPALGTTSGLIAGTTGRLIGGTTGLLIGGGLYFGVNRYSSGCSCSGSCSC